MKEKTIVSPTEADARRRAVLEMSDDAFVAQYERFVRGIVRQTFYFAGADASFDVDDLVQIGLLKLLKARNRYNGSAAFSTYAYVVVQNAVRSEVRAHKAHMDFENRILVDFEAFEDGEELISPPQFFDESFSEGIEPLISSDATSAIHRIYSDAKPANRRNIEFFVAHAEGETVDSIAIRSGLPSARVRTYINRGKTYLAAQPSLKKLAFGA